jgi:hypothetical protein
MSHITITNTPLAGIIHNHLYMLAVDITVRFGG